tara:strand:- start:570 stop:1703 length:1134 start_codon:yes stop_codon:yes gene_type:complete
MAQEIKEGLMAAATGLIEGFGTTMMRNVEQRDKEEREFVRSQASFMRERIAKGRAKQSKLENEVRSRLTTIETQTPGLLDSDKIAYASDQGSFNAYQTAVASDRQLLGRSAGKKIEDIGGTWYNQKDEAGKRVNPYVRKSAEATAMATLMEGVFPKVSVAPTPEKEEETTGELLNRIFGGDTDPNKLLDIAERKVVSQRGIGKVPNLDLYYARGGQAIQPSAKVGTPIGPVTAPAKPTTVAANFKQLGTFNSISAGVLQGISGTSSDPLSNVTGDLLKQRLNSAENIEEDDKAKLFAVDASELYNLNAKISRILEATRLGDAKSMKLANDLEKTLTPTQRVYRDFLLEVQDLYRKIADGATKRTTVAEDLRQRMGLK